MKRSNEDTHSVDASSTKRPKVDSDQDEGSGVGASAGSSGRERVLLVGSGNWGSAIAKIMGENIDEHPDLFEPVANMWVFEEEVDGRKLSEIINETHENVKYLPGIKLPSSIRAVPDLVAAAEGATIVVFVVPHQFIGKVCDQLRGRISSRARAISLIKGGMEVSPTGFSLLTTQIEECLGIPCSVLMGANIANEVARGDFSEATIGTRDPETGVVLSKLFDRPSFKIDVVPDVEAVELCGTLKNIVAVAAGLCDGLGFGNNTKSAVMRIGLLEMKKLVMHFFPKSDVFTFFESCGVADLIATCMGGRNRKVAKAFAAANGSKSFEELEAELLNGQKLQGTLTAQEVFTILDHHKMTEEYPLFTKVYRIAYEGLPPAEITNLRP